MCVFTYICLCILVILVLNTYTTLYFVHFLLRAICPTKGCLKEIAFSNKADHCTQSSQILSLAITTGVQ